jgi:hypothetical protein
MSESAKKQRPKTRPPRAEPVRERGAEVVQPRRRPEGRKEKSSGLVVNKAAEIRRVASLLVSEGELPRPKTIRERLGRKGIVVTSQQVSMALSNTEFAYRRNQIDQRRSPVFFPEPTLALGQVSIDDVYKAREFVRSMGSLEKAMAALVALGQFGGEGDKTSGQGDAPFVSDCRWPVKEKAEKPTS